MSLSGAIGAVKINCTVGSLDLSTSIDELYIYEDITSSHGPACEIRAVDAKDDISKNKINGSDDQDVVINLSDEFGGSSNFKFKLHEGANLNDESQYKQGGLHAKSYAFNCVSPEFKNAQANYAQFSAEDKTTNIAKKVLNDCYKTDKPIEIDEDAKEKRRWVTNNEHPFDVMQKLNDEHVGTQSKSSCYAVFQQQRNGQQVNKITTYEKMFKQAPVCTLTLSATNDSSSSTFDDKRNSISWINVKQNFFSGAEHGKSSSQQTINMTTHGVVDTEPKQNKFVLPGKEVDSSVSKKAKKVPQRSVYSKLNEPNGERITAAEAKVNRAQFLRDLAQNSAELECPYNPNITVGCMINLNLPNRTDAALGQGGTEKQFNGPVLVVASKIRIKPMGKSSEGGKSAIRATQTLTVAKASFDT